MRDTGVFRAGNVDDRRCQRTGQLQRIRVGKEGAAIRAMICVDLRMQGCFHLGNTARKLEEKSAADRTIQMQALRLEVFFHRVQLGMIRAEGNRELRGSDIAVIRFRFGLANIIGIRFQRGFVFALQGYANLHVLCAIERPGQFGRSHLRSDRLRQAHPRSRSGRGEAQAHANRCPQKQQ